MKPLSVIAGPTASGKSALAMAKAARENGVIINADASQLYCDLSILSARPTPADEASNPHRLYGVLAGDDPCSAARWAMLARQAIERVWQEGRIPILVGGTGLYLSALLEGIAPVPGIAGDIRAAVRALDGKAARQALEAEDPAMAAGLHPNDRQRTMRALEVVRATGRSLRDWQSARGEGLLPSVDLDATLLVPARDELHRRIDARFDAMMAAGAVDEVVRLLAHCYPPDLPVMKALGVPALAAHVRGEIPLEAAVVRAKLDSRRYAKRQQTWFATGGQSRGWLLRAKRLQS